MPFDKLLDFVEELIEYGWFRSDDIGFVAIASGEVLGGDDRYLVPGSRLNEQHLRVVVRENGIRNHLLDEPPQVQCFVGCLLIQH